MTKISRDDIISAAIELFNQHGYHGASMRDIARAVGIRKASLYHHFESKQALLLTILDMSLERLIEPLEKIGASDDPPEVKLRAAVRHHATLIAQHPDVATLLLTVDGALDDEQRDYYVARRDAFENVFRQILQEGVQQGIFRDTPPAISAWALLGMVNWMTRWYNPGGPLTGEELADLFSDLFLHGQLVDNSHNGAS